MSIITDSGYKVSCSHTILLTKFDKQCLKFNELIFPHLVNRHTSGHHKCRLLRMPLHTLKIRELCQSRSNGCTDTALNTKVPPPPPMLRPEKGIFLRGTQSPSRNKNPGPDSSANGNNFSNSCSITMSDSIPLLLTRKTSMFGK